jgi:hypothetical protein
MHDKFLFEYAVIRIVPRVEREEFVNAGVILYCARPKFLQAKFSLNEERLRLFSPDADMNDLRENLRSFEQISLGTKDSGPIGQLDPASRFRWLTAARSTVLQTSKVHPGFCADPSEMLFKLFRELVL